MSHTRVVLHVGEAGSLPHALANAENLLAAAPGAALRLVLNGPAVLAVQGHNKVTARLAQVLSAGAEVQLCRNALAAQGLDEQALSGDLPGDLRPHLGHRLAVVPAGVLALAQAQAEGFAYIKV